MNDITKLLRKNVQKLVPYQSARRIGGHGDVWLNANESPLSTIFETEKKMFNRYPECQPKNLIKSYARYVNLSPDQILSTRGADEGIELLIKAFCEPGIDKIIYCPPTYDMYQINAKIAGVKIEEIPTIKNTWKIDVSSIKLKLNQVKLIYICNPNNPTGNIISQDTLINLLKITSGKCLVVIDEAYIEFSPNNSMINFLKEYSNLVILRTLSKAFALAGIRCGFTLSTKEVINALHKVISPYPIPSPVSDIAAQALTVDSIKLMKNRVSILNLNRFWLVKKLKNMPCVKKVFNSHANYVLVQFFMFDKIFKTLWNNGIILRNQNHKINLRECLRISIGSRQECMRVIEELKKFV
ncbi:histidinol-phosphate transaminase [Buchnera aphidicola]